MYRRMPLAWWLASMLAALWLLAAPPALAEVAEVAVPPLQARVTDLTGTLSASERSSLESTLQAFEAKKGSQIAVLLVPTTQPETVEQFAIRVAEAWKLGRKGVDDGVLLLVAKNDRKLRIEVGYGLEGVIPDAVAKRVISEAITPYFKQGDFSGGVRAGVEQLMRLIEGESLPALKVQSAASYHFEPWHLILGLFGLFLLLLILSNLYEWLMGIAAGGLLGIIVGLGVWAYTSSPMLAVVSGVIVFLFILGNGNRKVGRGGRRRGGSSGGGSWSSSSGDWSSGGGFSGGGGSFGGGGASGDW